MTHTNTRRAASARTVSLILIAAMLGACGAPRLAPDTPTGVSLAGKWRLDRQASQDPQALIAALQAKANKRMRRDDYENDLYGPYAEDPGATESRGGGPGGGGGGREGRPGGSSETRSGESGGPGGGGFRMRAPRNLLTTTYNAALGARLSGDGLNIEQAADRFVITRGDSRRAYTPGGQSVVSVADGVADQSSGWKGREYVIDVRPQVGPHLNERYGLTADGKLIEKVVLTDDGLPKLEFTRVYEKGEAPARGLPTSN